MKLSSLPYFIATGGFSGKSPILPGTAGTFVAFLLSILLFEVFPQLPLSVTALSLAAVCTALGLATINALFSSGHYGSGEKDPQEIVIDEFAGYFISLSVAEPSVQSMFYCFLLFRLFDMSKPPPIRRLEKLPGAYGIMFDDLLAGVYAALTFLLLKAAFA